MDNKKKYISIIIPCYNEEYRLPPTLRKISEYIKSKRDIFFEIIVVDDGSNDNTIGVTEQFRDEIPNLRILKNEKNTGKGYSVRKGMLESEGDYIIFMDSDSSTDIKELNKFIEHFDDYDIIIGSRHVKGGSVVVQQSIIRRFFGYFAHLLIRKIIISDVDDTMCGFKLFNKRAKILFEKQLVNQWGFDYEILFLAKKFNFKIKEIPVNWTDDKMSKVTMRGYINSLLELINIRINDILGKYDNNNRSL